MGKRFEVVGFRNDEKDMYIFGTAHNEQEKLSLLFKAVKAGCDSVSYYEY